jgi:hypothetical protein
MNKLRDNISGEAMVTLGFIAIVLMGCVVELAAISSARNGRKPATGQYSTKLPARSHTNGAK